MEPETPNPAPAKPRGRFAHKPDCACRPCKAARVRAEAAIANGSGVETGQEAGGALAKPKPQGIRAEPATLDNLRCRKTRNLVGTDTVPAGQKPCDCENCVAYAAQEPIYADVIVAQDRSPRARITEWALLRSQGMRNKDIAARLGIQPQTLNTLISKATKAGWLKFDNPEERLEHELTPLIVDNIKHYLVEGDKKMTIEAAKGVGLFKSHQAVKVEGNDQQMVLAIKIETPNGFDPATVVAGTIVGKPKTPVD